MSKDNVDDYDGPLFGSADAQSERGHERGSGLAWASMRVILLDREGTPITTGFIPWGGTLHDALRVGRRVGARSVVRVVALIDQMSPEDRVH